MNSLILLNCCKTVLLWLGYNAISFCLISPEINKSGLKRLELYYTVRYFKVLTLIALLILPFCLLVKNEKYLYNCSFSLSSYPINMDLISCNDFTDRKWVHNDIMFFALLQIILTDTNKACVLNKVEDNKIEFSYLVLFRFFIASCYKTADVLLPGTHVPFMSKFCCKVFFREW